MENKYFIKFVEHSPEFYELIKQRPTAFVLLALIVDRARKTPLAINDGIEIGEAYIGDYKEYGATRQSYRTDVDYLVNYKIITIKITNRGTIAKIVNTSIFDISRNLSTNKLTNNQPTTNQQATTKQEVRSKNKDIINTSSDVKKQTRQNNYATSDSITPQVLAEIAKKHSILEKEINEVFDDLKYKVEKGEYRKPKDWKRTLDKWVCNAIKWRNIIPQKDNLAEFAAERGMTPEQVKQRIGNYE